MAQTQEAKSMTAIAEQLLNTCLIRVQADSIIIQAHVISIPVPELIEFEKCSNGLHLHRPGGRILVKTFAQNNFDLLA
ncbi:BQ5605_C002g01314 [Microbotryum silenes-dioicae]|uniref:BQ5605_C002g01314 protein n=1 Tax=Microbotryum silenes-dioicae TaxID=796604 RepID=A0A2X0NW07_9BASI|nr:BQ5605_C002g01314 [Microbotryum silenes-dioicae]